MKAVEGKLTNRTLEKICKECGIGSTTIGPYKRGRRGCVERTARNGCPTVSTDRPSCSHFRHILCHSPVCYYGRAITQIGQCDYDMKLVSGQIRLAATDLSNHLACRHMTALDLQVVRGETRAPDWAAPDLVVIRERGERHETAYLTHLAEQKKLAVVSLAEIKG